jgi:hypothetical protein
VLNAWLLCLNGRLAWRSECLRIQQNGCRLTPTCQSDLGRHRQALGAVCREIGVAIPDRSGRCVAWCTPPVSVIEWMFGLCPQSEEEPTWCFLVNGWQSLLTVAFGMHVPITSYRPNQIATIGARRSRGTALGISAPISSWKLKDGESYGFGLTIQRMGRPGRSLMSSGPRARAKSERQTACRYWAV